eukprot:symbB.v1.2.000848.t1/scaffold37.1/size397765/20
MAVVADAFSESREWQDVLRISEDLRQAVCKIQTKLASEREILLAERAAAAAEKAAATAEREQAERLVKIISAAADRCSAWTGAKEATQMSGRAFPMPGQVAAPKGVVVKQPPQRPTQSPMAAPTNGSYPLAAPPMPSRNPPAVAQAPVQETAEASGTPGTVAPRVKAPPIQGRRTASSVPAAIEAQKDQVVEAKVNVAQDSRSKSSSATVVPRQANEDEIKEDTIPEAPAPNTPKRSSPSTHEDATEEAAVPSTESNVGGVSEPLLDDYLEDEEDEMDEHDLWAMNAPSPPSKAHPTESPHFRVMPPPRGDPQSDLLPDELETGLSLPPEEDREYAEPAPMEESFDGELERGEDSASRAMPPREGPSSSAWPVGKAAASRYKAPPAALFGSSASSSDRRTVIRQAGNVGNVGNVFSCARDGGSEAPSASSAATPEASAGLITSSVKAPPHRSTPSTERSTVQALVEEGYELFYGGGYHDTGKRDTVLKRTW